MKKRFLAMALSGMLAFSALAVQPVQAAAPMPEEGSITNSTVWGDSRGISVVNDHDELWFYYLKQDKATFHHQLDSSQTRCLMTGVEMIAEANSNLMVLKKDGTLWTYHYSGYEKKIMGPLKLMDNVEKVVANGWYHFGVLKKDGTLWDIEPSIMNYTDGVLNAAEYPMKVLNTGVTNVNEDGYYLKGNEVWHFGSGATKLEKTLPFSDGKNIYFYSTAFYVLTEDGDLWSWGNNGRGLLGNGGQYDSYGNILYVGSLQEGWTGLPIRNSKPTKILEDIERVWAETIPVYAIAKDGTIWVWGDGEPSMIYVYANGTFGERNFAKSAKGYTPRKTTVTEWKCYPNSRDAVFRADGTLWVERSSAAADETLIYVGRWMGTEPQPLFKDVPLNLYCAEPVEWAVDNSITSGTGATTFSPDQNCSQAHILTFLWKAAGKPAVSVDNPYTNRSVSAGQYFYQPFLWAYAEGLVDDVNMDPNAGCSRSDVVSYLWKLEGMPKVAGNNGFSDVSAAADYADAVAWAVQSGVTSGTSSTTFSPAQICTRGQIVTFLYRYFE